MQHNQISLSFKLQDIEDFEVKRKIIGGEETAISKSNIRAYLLCNDITKRANIVDSCFLHYVTMLSLI